MPIHPPTTVLDAVGPFETWEPIDSTNDRPAHVWVAADYVINRRPVGEGLAEAARFDWLDQRVAAASLVVVAREESPGAETGLEAEAGADWVVTTRLAGVPASQVELHGDVGGITATFAHALRAIHDTPVDEADFPFGIGWDNLAAQVSASLSTLDPATLPDPYSRYSAERLGEIWHEGRPSTTDELVLCHGDPSLPNLIVDPAAVGWVDVGRLRLGDRHLDLAIAQRSIHRNFGPDAVFAFFEAYDFDPDLVRLDHYLLANFLMP